MCKKILILVGPSGSGKDTIKTMIEKELGYVNLISTTTRDKRENEINGIHYNFIALSEFNKIIENKGFLEYTKFNNNYYGKQLKDVHNSIEKNDNIITILETNGIKSVIEQKSFFMDKGYELNILFLDISRNKIKERMLLRGDKITDINERLQNNDYEYFQEIKNNFADIIVNVDNKTPTEILKEINTYI